MSNRAREIGVVGHRDQIRAPLHAATAGHSDPRRGRASELSPNQWCTSPGAESGSTKNDVHRVNLKMQF
jgi:hypothetical protein